MPINLDCGINDQTSPERKRRSSLATLARRDRRLQRAGSNSPATTTRSADDTFEWPVQRNEQEEDQRGHDRERGPDLHYVPAAFDCVRVFDDQKPRFLQEDLRTSSV